MSLPYTDSKPTGAADFYFAINATFRFILQRFGLEGLRWYWTDLGTRYFAPVTARWKSQGLEGVAAYWEAFFRAEPGSEVHVQLQEDQVVLEVTTCPAIHHLRENRREIVPCFCQHCYFVSEAMAAPAGLMVRIQGGNGQCRQIFRRCDPSVPEQQLSDIKEAKC